MQSSASWLIQCSSSKLWRSVCTTRSGLTVWGRWGLLLLCSEYHSVSQSAVFDSVKVIVVHVRWLTITIIYSHLKRLPSYLLSIPLEMWALLSEGSQLVEYERDFPLNKNGVDKIILIQSTVCIVSPPKWGLTKFLKVLIVSTSTTSIVSAIELAKKVHLLQVGSCLRAYLRAEGENHTFLLRSQKVVQKF